MPAQMRAICSCCLLLVWFQQIARHINSSKFRVRHPRMGGDMLIHKQPASLKSRKLPSGGKGNKWRREGGSKAKKSDVRLFSG
jgi:hypothetical protein